jgi:O-antigen ligase
VTVLVISFPILFLVTSKIDNIVFYSLLICSFIVLIPRVNAKKKGFLHFLKQYWPLHLAMGGLVIAVFIHQLFTAQFVSNAYDIPSRLACFPLLVWLMLSLEKKDLKYIQWSIFIGALLGFIVLQFQTLNGTERPVFIFHIPLIPFTNIILMMGMLTLLTIGWHSANERIVICAKLIVGGLAIYGTYLAQTRGSWVALPVFLIIGLATLKPFSNKKIYSLLAIVLLCSPIILGGNTYNRIAAAKADINNFIEKDEKNSSIGLRLQLWNGSWQLFKDNYLLGIGPKKYAEAAENLYRNKTLTAEAAQQPHSHNDVLYQMVTLGMPGMLAILALYFLPAFYFFKDINNNNQEVRVTAGMGLALCLGFFVYGLSDTMFYWRISYIFYIISLAWIFATLIKHKET